MEKISHENLHAQIVFWCIFSQMASMCVDMWCVRERQTILNNNEAFFIFFGIYLFIYLQL